MTEESRPDDRECLNLRERATASPADVPLIIASCAPQADVPGTALCLDHHPAESPSHTMPMPGNPVPSRSKQSFRRGDRPSAFIGIAALPLRPPSGGCADGRRWTTIAVEAMVVQKAGVPEQRQRQRQ